MELMEFIVDSPYVCPLLMKLQSCLLRQDYHYGCDGWAVLSGPNSRASCIFPECLILQECRFWNSRIGVWLRSKTKGAASRERRLSA